MTRVPENMIDRVLRASAAAVERTGPWRWRMTVGNGYAIDAASWLDDGWLSMSAPMPDGLDDSFGLLRLNHGLPLASRIGIGTGGRALVVRSEVPVTPCAELEASIEEACAGLSEACCRVRTRTVPKKVPADAAVADVRGLLESMADRCSEAGWASNSRSRELAIELDVPEACHVARLSANGGGVDVAVDLIRRGDWPDQSRRAIGLLLLGACDALRFVRAAADDDAVRFEVSFGHVPAPAELDDALGALSTACRLYAREVETLIDGRVASRLFARVCGQLIDQHESKEVRQWN